MNAHYTTAPRGMRGNKFWLWLADCGRQTLADRADYSSWRDSSVQDIRVAGGSTTDNGLAGRVGHPLDGYLDGVTVNPAA